MNVSVSFPPEIERVLRRRAAAAGQDVATFVREVVAESLAEEGACLAEGEGSRPLEAAAAQGFAQRLAAWVALFPVLDHAIDDSRESIYAGRGE